MTDSGREQAALDNLTRANPVAADLLVDPQIEALARSVTRLSGAFGRLLVSDPRAMHVLEDLQQREPVPSDPSALGDWSRREMLRIACRDLSGLDDVRKVGAALALLADDVWSVAVAAVEDTEELAVIGMGKLGGSELNYASDVDVMFVGSASDKTLRKVADIARSCFRVDLNLRPEGRNGRMIRSVDSFESYWEQWASPWEFQALLKSRPIAGNEQVGNDWKTAAERALWGRTFDVDDINYVRRMKQRSEELATSTRGGHEVKRGRGGIRDVEFAVQLLQLVHGQADKSIRSPNTLIALEQLTAGGYVSQSDADALAESYELLRDVEHRVQMVELQQTHTVPADDTQRSRIAASLHRPLDKFDNDLRKCRATVRQAFERLYFRPLLEAFAGHAPLDPATLESRVAALGFSDAERTRQAVIELTEGMTRASQLMRQLMPLILDWLSASPDPDRGLLGLRRLVSGHRTPVHLVGAFRDSPEVARRVCQLLGTAATFEHALNRHPELFEYLDDRRRNREGTVAERMNRTMQWRTDPLGRRTTLARFNDAEKARIAMLEVLRVTGHENSCVERSALADAVLSTATHELVKELPVAVVALGRYGGEELGPGSDLDVMIVHDCEQSAAEQVAQQLLNSVGNPSPAFRLYDLDYGLRPEGKQGPLARSIASCAEYYGKWASTWERQALLRARHVCGDPDVARRFFAIAEDFVWSAPIGDAELREIRHLKARMETERIPRNEDPRFHLKLGKGTSSDVEWTVQLLQLQHRVRSNSTMSALRQLTEAGAIEAADAAVLEEAWRFCTAVRDRLSLIEGRPMNSLPTDRARLDVLARSLETSAGELQSRYMRLTRRCRSVVERLFYDKQEV